MKFLSYPGVMVTAPKTSKCKRIMLAGMMIIHAQRLPYGE